MDLVFLYCFGGVFLKKSDRSAPKRHFSLQILVFLSCVPPQEHCDPSCASTSVDQQELQGGHIGGGVVGNPQNGVHMC